MTERELEQVTEDYVDGIFGEGSGRKHIRFLNRIQNAGLRDMIHGYHALEGDTTELSLEENYLIGMCVLCAGQRYATAAMFAKTLLHLGVRPEKLLEAVGRLAMWIGGLPAVEATFAIQKAIREYQEHGVGSLAAWFPEEGPR